MSIFAIGDPHLSLGSEKPMDIFRGWEDYQERLAENWKKMIKPEDTVVLAGDISWALTLEEALEDLTFLHNLPGSKVLLKGNHDYWWNTKAKMERFFTRNGLNSLMILHNNAVLADGVALCGSRGWAFESNEDWDPLIELRELGRIRRSLEAAPAQMEKLLFLHYPPIYQQQVQEKYFDLMEEFGVKECWYGHLHGPALAGAFEGYWRGVKLRLISADFLKFIPLRVRILKK